jgi:hypothetical protein
VFLFKRRWRVARRVDRGVVVDVFVVVVVGRRYNGEVVRPAVHVTAR